MSVSSSRNASRVQVLVADKASRRSRCRAAAETAVIVVTGARGVEGRRSRTG